ncbi:DUF2157 domain-containing protein [Brunnivagina elsteri]|uniref:DUF2157 domain-containing protein n=1 Tax=Brunnivagina elsteri CCALA 953 TaxID=987040 RepID=A0A2A2TL45_9CYAN|nr:DUF2157 domain-containing protein [Calothrix elsteri]PAX57938.1 DUF2157 domain-containing protein [Calothrix elsteri CCALA 953]
MSSNFEQSLNINVRLPSYHPDLLVGIEIWLELGLISDSQVRQICREHLVCRLQKQPDFIPEKTVHNVETLPASSLKPEKTQLPKKPDVLAGMLQSLKAELSVRWLLFLGIFLVVVSSGLLAASQWERFPISGQYGVLLVYTLSFFGVSFWAGKQPNLRLTTQGLLVVTQLLIPVNFWAIDGFRLWQNPLGWLVMAVAFVTLTGTAIAIGNSRLINTNLPSRNLGLFSGLRVINILGLSYLHLGWSIPGFSLVAIYIAMIGTSLINVYQKSLEINQEIQRVDNQERKRGIHLPVFLIICALGLLLSRGIFVTGVDITLLGLAIAICGWLVTRLGEVGEERASLSPSLAFPWQFIGGVLIFLGWVMSVVSHPAQALAVSALGLWILAKRLQLFSFKSDFTTIFLIGLQANWLIWRLVPVDLQLQITTVAIKFTNLRSDYWGLWSLGLFPYLLAIVAFSEYFRRFHSISKKIAIADFSERVSLVFGILLTFLAASNSGLLSLNLVFSAITLAVVTYRKHKRQRENSNYVFSPNIIYLTHVTAILAFCSCINWGIPTLRYEYWAAILLILMVGEWIFSVGAGIWKRSAWYAGFGLGAISFYLLLVTINSNLSEIYSKPYYWSTIWLVTPITLSAIASRSTGVKGRVNSVSSVISLCLSQLLTLPLTKTRLIGLGVAAVLMLVNTGYLQSQEFALITVGFILAFIGVVLWEGIPGLALLSISGWFIVSSIMILGLWMTRKYLLSRSIQNSNNNQNSLSQVNSITEENQKTPLLRGRFIIYAKATNKWGCILFGIELLALTLHSVGVYQGLFTADIFYILAAFITLLSVTFRSLNEPSNWAFYGIGWCLELLASEALAFGGRTTIKIAIANIALGLASQLFGEWWKRKHRLQELPSSFHVLPIIYALFSVVLRFNTFTTWTGLYTLGVGLILIGVGRRRQALKPLLYLGLIGVSLSAYEFLFYQMLQAQGGAYGDTLIAMSALGAIIMYVYRILSPWLIQYLRLTKQEIEAVAHYHWGWSSCLLLIAIISPVEINRFIGLGTGTFLARYAIFQGRLSSSLTNSPTNSSTNSIPGFTGSENWVYLGLLEIVAVGILLRDLPIGRLFAQQLLPWNGAIACIVAYFLYILPWQRWGWSKTPWQNAAYILPLGIVGITWLQVYPVTLLITAGFYCLVARMNNYFRFVYISVVLMDWALFKWFYDLRLTNELWYVAIIGLSLLFIAQFDPELKLTQQKNNRHYLRLLGSGIICGSAVIFHQDTALIPSIIGIIFIFAGLSLRIRAFLYVGTGAFLITAIYQLVILSLRYSFMKWVIGLCVGILFISIAANFETRREQLTSLFSNTSNEFNEWE